MSRGRRNLELRINSSRVVAVPSMHYCYPFAAEVRRICADSAQRPDAIAVELPEVIAAAAWTWIRELGSEDSKLPCMLGLIGDGAEGPRRATGVSLLCLTPSDSIVEAIRTGIERRIPVYGIDSLQPAGRHVPALVSDPLAGGDCVAWAEANSRYAAWQRDVREAEPREQTMARRLTYLASRHARILLVCGLAHWDPLRSLLRSGVEPEGVRPCDEVSPSPHIVRSIVHPVVALPFMDRFPQLVEAYEHARVGATDPETTDLVSLLDAILTRADAAHFLGTTDRQTTGCDWEARRDFEEMLTRMAAIEQRRVPSASTVLSVAAETMSLPYRRRLVEEILRYPWATSRHPRLGSLPLLVPSSPRDRSEALLVDENGKSGPAFRVAGSEVPAVPWDDATAQWSWEGGRPEQEPAGEMVVNWAPIDRLVTAFTLRAMEVARAQADEPRTDVFGGSLEDGLAIRSTIRAYGRGSEDLYVRSTARRRQTKSRTDESWDLVVWIFRLTAPKSARWRALGEEFFELIPHAMRPEEMRAVEQQRGNVVIEQVGFGTHKWAWGRQTEVRGGHSMLEWSGVLAFTPNHFGLRQTALFIEAQGFRGMPIARYPFPTSTAGQQLQDNHPFVTGYRDTYHMTLDLADWPTTLIRMAVPFADSSITVVAPDGFTIPRHVREEAAKRRVDVRSVPHSIFPRQALETMSRWFGAVPTMNASALEFSPAVERRFGESASSNSHLLPPYWLHYGATATARTG